MIRIAIADDHAIVTGGLKQMFSTTPDISVVAVASSSVELMAQLRANQPDLLLTDLSMPGVSGVELIEKMHRQFPQLPILVLSMHNEAPIVSRALRAGASGYITKDSEPEILISAIRTVAAGRRYIDPALVDRVVFDKQKPSDDPLQTLSDRELQVLTLIARGDGLTEIAVHLSVSPKTVSTHKMRLMQKLGITNNAELIRFAVEHNMIGI